MQLFYFIYLMQMYNSNCAHNMPRNSFCTECMHYICALCEDPHRQTTKILSPEFIQNYITRSNTESAPYPTQDQANAVKSSITQKITNTIDKLQHYLTQSIEHITLLSTKPQTEDFALKITKMELKDGAVNMLEDLAKSMKSQFSACNKLNEFQSFISSTDSTIDKINKLIGHKIEEMKSQSSPVSQLCELHYWSEKTLTLFDQSCQEISSFKLEKEMNSRAESISHLNSVYFIGGELINKTFHFNISNKLLTKKSPMLIKKYQHSLVLVNNIIYAIGGYTGKTIGECEKYDISGNTWSDLANLNHPRYCCASFVMNNKYLYAFGGIYNENLNSLERIDINNLLHWEDISVSNVLSPRYCIYGIQIKNDEALIFGGEKDDISKECYVLKFDKEVSCMQVNNMLSGGYFRYSSAPFNDGKCVYAVDFYKRIHKYAISDNAWIN